VDRICDAVTRLAADPSLRAALAARGRPFVAAHYDRNVLAERYLTVLERAARGAAATATL
jgi:glycosyltransferase involved in cell wall biosynthesis